MSFFYGKDDENKDVNFSSLDVLRWMATIAVINYHVFNAIAHVTNFKITIYSHVWYDLLAVPLRWHVPIFLMISGALFLNPKKEISYKAVFSKYIKRILLALLLFCMVFSSIEYYFETKTVNFDCFLRSFNNVIIGNSWSHLWYLYMIIGIYLIVPPLKMFINAASTKDIYIFSTIIFLFVCILPSINSLFNYKTGFYIPISGVYILYFVLGYFCFYRIRYNMKVKYVSLLLIIGCCAILAGNAIFFWNLPTSSSSPLICVLTLSIFIFIISIKANNIYLSRGRHLCFGIYLVHMVFINFAYKFLKIQPFDYFPLISMFVIGTITLLTSLVTTYMLYRIPIMKKIL